MKNEYFPALIKSDNSKVNGILYFDIPANLWKVIDLYKGEMYNRIEIDLNNDLETKTCTYILKNEYHHLLENTDWNYNYFMKHHKNLFLKQSL